MFENDEYIYMYMYIYMYVCMRNIGNSIDAQLNEYYYPRE